MNGYYHVHTREDLIRGWLGENKKTSHIPCVSSAGSVKEAEITTPCLCALPLLTCVHESACMGDERAAIFYAALSAVGAIAQIGF